MRKSRYGLSLCAASLALISLNSAAQEYSKQYQPPTRGFIIEHGSVKTGEYVSFEMHTGADSLDTGGSLRLGLPQAELIFNSGFSNYDFYTNEVMLKWAMPASSGQNTSQAESKNSTNTKIHWSLIGAIATVNTNAQNSVDQTNLTIGAAATIHADAGTFTIAPYLVMADSDDEAQGGIDDTFAELDLGAHVGLIETSVGLFSAGIEVNLTTQDDVDETVALGARWSYNEQVNLDIVPLIYSNNDIRGIPGVIRLNVVF